MFRCSNRIYNFIWGVAGKEEYMKNDPLIIRKRGEDGTKIISVRIKEDLLIELDKASSESNYSRNELINIIIRYGLDNLMIE